MTNKNDWRLTNQMNYLFQKALIQKHYQPFRKGWEHNHCEFCETRIDSSLPFAYATEDDYHWVCEECYQDFKEMFQWTVINAETSEEQRDIEADQVRIVIFTASRVK